MTVTDQLKILDDEIKTNQAQYDLSREAPKISVLSSKDLLDMYEYLIWSIIHSIVLQSLKTSTNLKDCHLILLKILKRFTMLKNVTPETDENKDQQEKVLNNVGDLFNELYYIYKDKCSEENNGLKTKDTQKLRLTNDYQHESEEEKEHMTSKKPDKKNT